MGFRVVVSTEEHGDGGFDAELSEFAEARDPKRADRGARERSPVNPR